MEERLVLHDACANFRSNTCQPTKLIKIELLIVLQLKPTRLWPSTLNGDQVVGLLHRLEDGLRVQRSDRTQINYLRLDTDAGQLLSRLQRGVDQLRVCNNCDVLARTLNLGLTNGQNKLLVQHLIGHGIRNTVDHFVFQKHDRIEIANGSLQQTLKWN